MKAYYHFEKGQDGAPDYWVVCLGLDNWIYSTLGQALNHVQQLQIEGY